MCGGVAKHRCVFLRFLCTDAGRLFFLAPMAGIEAGADSGFGGIPDLGPVAFGGGAGDDNDTYAGSPIKDHEWGFGLTVESDFLHGTSSPCLTFGSPSLSCEHSDGSIFEIINLELWTVTPCNKLEDAEKLELAGLFLESNRRK